VEIKGSEGNSLTVSSANGTIKFPEKKWKKWLKANQNSTIAYYIYVKRDGKWKQFKTFENKVSDAEIDPYLYYRLLFPGYESWSEIKIVQRSLDSFHEKSVIENNVVEQNCVNCHSFNQQNTGNFMFHMRGSLGGTYFLKDGELEKFDLKTKEMQSNATYARWHPSGKYIAYSTNKVVQQFHSVEDKKIEVSDLSSSLVLYDFEKNEMMRIPVDESEQFMDTYPEWSPDGKTLYFCRAPKIAEVYDYKEINYNLCEVSFNADTRKFGEPKIIFNAAAEGKSVSFPRVSPDGKSLVFTYHNYGVFSIWHKDADLYSINLKDLSVKKMENLNSDFTESYHSWSANGKWLIFSSKRDDGLTARPYISFVDENGITRKPFVLPQEDPGFYNTFDKTFNIPEFAKTEVSFGPGEIRKAAEKEAVKVTWSNNL
ncbi:MAG TPA: hypothetical protein P5210_10230, partial [Draconibacterium sp.]|nr:hypothetical protein [Draconibacterium sp.]